MDQLTGSSCVVVLRHDTNEDRITGYSVGCGDTAPIAATEARESLLPLSSVNWSAAVPIETSGTDLYAFTTTNGQAHYTAYISELTGKLLLTLEEPLLAPEAPSWRGVEWHSVDDLGEPCGPVNHPSRVFGEDLEVVGYQDLDILSKTDTLRAIREKFGSVRAVAHTSTRGPERLIFISATDPSAGLP